MKACQWQFSVIFGHMGSLLEILTALLAGKAQLENRYAGAVVLA
jgi:hypothetical protein